jgi:hypothetical protein
MQFAALVLAAVAVAVTASCESSTAPPDPGDASYSVALTPAPIIYATVTCDRYLSYAILSLGRRNRGFDLSINVMNDCTRGGGTWTYGEVYTSGHYTMTDSVLTFTPDPGRMPPFTGTFDATYVRIILPVRSDSLALAPIPLQLGPKMPF